MPKRYLKQMSKPGSASSRCGLLAIVGLMSLALAGNAVAAPAIGKGGKISACYRVKGKAKGAMRVVPAKQAAAGTANESWPGASPARLARQAPMAAAGAQGQSGANGAQGQPGSDGTSGTGEAALETKIADLTVKIASLENILNGVDGTELTETINGLPVLETTVSGLGTNVSGLTTDVSGRPRTSKASKTC